MFEQPVGRVEKDRSRLIILSSGTAVLVVIVLIVLVSSYCGGETKVDVVRRGSAEFDSYASTVSVVINDKRTGVTGLGNRYARILCTVQNNGDRVLTALELRGVVAGFSNEVLKDKVISLVPRSRDTLEPNQSIDVDLNIEPIPDPSEIMDMFVEVHGLKVQ
jgi:hypothetical protein